MKRGSMVILALVMALTLVMGSVSTVSAMKPIPEPTANVSAEIVQNHAGDYLIKYSYSWSNDPATESWFLVYDVTDGNKTLVDKDVIYSRPKSKGSRKGSVNIPNNTDTYYIVLHLYDSTGLIGTADQYINE